MENPQQQQFPSNPSLLENPYSVKSLKYQEQDKEEEKQYESKRMKFLVEHPEFDFLKNNPSQLQSNQEIKKNSRYGQINPKGNQSKNNLGSEKGVDNFRGIQQGGQVGIQDEIISDLSERGVQNYYRDNSIQKLNQSMDVYNKPNNNMSYQRQKTIEYNSNSPVKLPSVVQHLYNSVNMNNKIQPISRYSQDTLKERQQRQKEIKQRLYQVMAPQESYYEKYNGFYHQNDYSMNVNEDLIKNKLFLQNQSLSNSNQFNQQHNNSFTNYLMSNQIKGKSNNISNIDNLSQPKNLNDQTPIFKDNETLKGNAQISQILGKSLDQIRDEDDRVSTRYSQINEINKFRLLQKRGLSSEKKDAFSTNLPSSIASSKISCFQNIPSYSFIDHVNAQLQQMRIAQQPNQITQNNSLLSSKVSIMPEQATQVKKIRSITYDGSRDSPQFSQNTNNSPIRDPNISSIKDYYNRKYNNKDPTINTEPSGRNYPRYDYSEFRMSNLSDNSQQQQQKIQLNQLRQRSSRSLLQDPNLKKRPESNNFSFQNSQTEKFHTPKQKQNQSFNAVEALQNIISEAAQVKSEKRSSRKDTNAYIQSNNYDNNEDIILDINVVEKGQPPKKISSRKNSNTLLINNLDNQDITLYNLNVKPKKQQQKTGQSQPEGEKSNQLNEAQIISYQDQYSLNQNQHNGSGYLNSTFNLQNELEKNP